MKTLISVDVEADGPYPIDYSMVCFGAAVIEPGLNRIFYGETAPISDKWIPGALAVSGITREKHLTFPQPYETMRTFANWLKTFERPVFVSDNPAFDWQFINAYLHRYAGGNPFGFSARRIGDFAAGLAGHYDQANNWKRLRRTPHTHNPVDDAKGNAEALLALLGREK